MSEAMKKLENSDSCGVSCLPPSALNPTSWETCGDEDWFCEMCNAQQEVCDELRAALLDTAILDTVVRNHWVVIDMKPSEEDIQRYEGRDFRQNFREWCEEQEIEVRCGP